MPNQRLSAHLAKWVVRGAARAVRVARAVRDYMLRLIATATRVTRAARAALRSGGHRLANGWCQRAFAKRSDPNMSRTPLRRAGVPAGGARFFREHRLQGGVASTKGCGYHCRLAAPRRGAICEQEDTCAHLPVSEDKESPTAYRRSQTNRSWRAWDSESCR